VVVAAEAVDRAAEGARGGISHAAPEDRGARVRAVTFTKFGIIGLFVGILGLGGCGGDDDGVVPGVDASLACTSAAQCDDQNACTTDACGTTGACTHLAVDLDDHDACTFESCDPATGVTHAQAAVDDQNACTLDDCDPATGVTHVPVATDDADPCTVDACDPATGTITHVAVATDDANACTTDACDPATGTVTHVAVAVDDGFACSADACDPATGVVTHAGDHLACASGQLCGANGCAAPATSDQAGHVVLDELLPLAGAAGNQGELIELHNPGATAIDLRGFTLRNAAGQVATLRATSDADGSAGTPITLAAGGNLYGVANPAAASDIPADAAFVYGEPGASFTLADGGDRLELFAANGAFEDVVDFRALHSDPTTPAPLMAFVATTGATLQLDPGAATATGNDDPLAWCVTFYPAAGAPRTIVADTAGAPNGSCGAAVISEVEIDAPSTDDGKTFVEIAGPGGALVGGMKLVDLEGVGAQAGQRNTDGDLAVGETDGEVVLPAGTRIPADGLLIVADGTTAGATSVPNVTSADVIVRDVDLENGGGDSLQLISASGELLDTLGFDANGNPLAVNLGVNGLAMVEGATALYSTIAGTSLARDLGATDTDDNLGDFHADPSPTPGLLSDSVGSLTAFFADDMPTARDLGTITVQGTELVGGMTIRIGDTAGVCSGTALGTQVLCTANNPIPDTAHREDFTLVWPAPFHRSITVANGFTWTGTQNESDSDAEADSCNLQAAGDLTVASGATTPVIFGRLFESGLTEAAGAPAGVLAEVGYGRADNDPLTTTVWRFFPASYDSQAGNDDQFAGSFPAPTASGTYRYAFRVSFDGGLTYTYCDSDGAGSIPGADYSMESLPLLTVP
jgi:hypothetical protein